MKGYLTRRRFISGTAVCGVSMALLGPTSILAETKRPHPLRLYHTHTGESLSIEFSPHSCEPGTHAAINHFLRDFRTGEVHPIDTELLALLCAIQRSAGSTGTYEIISGYRSEKTNALLRKKSGGVARKSLHMRGLAVDVRLTDLHTTALRDLAWSQQGGGVGYYRKSNFVHLDTGRVRRW
jgi:uncharacterized protein YcbK (DUF882 family)